MELPTSPGMETAQVVIGYFAFHPDEALKLAAMATSFARQQTQLYGTRDSWMKEQEAASAQRRLTDTENKLNSVMVHN